MSPELKKTVQAITSAVTFDARVALIRKIPEDYGKAHQADVYSAIAKALYVPYLAPDFAYVHWREEYELEPVEYAYGRAAELTDQFKNVDEAALTAVLITAPETLRIFRLLLGLTASEFAATTEMIADEDAGTSAVGASAVKGMESGRSARGNAALACAAVIDRAMRGVILVAPTEEVRSKLDKPDTIGGWETVRHYAADGIPLPVFLHQRHYGGAFRQLLDATSGKRGDIIEGAVEDLFTTNGVPFVKTGSDNQEEIARRFGLTVKPAPDFVVFDAGENLKALLECKGANDGGTARDKAARFAALRGEAMRLGGIPLFAVLAGLGWRRTADALGPVVRDCDGRVFSLPTLDSILEVQPFPTLAGNSPPSKP